jgi:hypothetical protein
LTGREGFQSAAAGSGAATAAAKADKRMSFKTPSRFMDVSLHHRYLANLTRPTSCRGITQIEPRR